MAATCKGQWETMTAMTEHRLVGGRVQTWLRKGSNFMSLLAAGAGDGKLNGRLSVYNQVLDRTRA